MGFFGGRRDKPVNYGQGIPVFDGSPITVQDAQGNDYTYTPGEWDSSRLDRFKNFSEYARQQALEAKLADARQAEAAKVLDDSYYRDEFSKAADLAPLNTAPRFNADLSLGGYNSANSWRGRIPDGMPSAKFDWRATPLPAADTPDESNAASSYSDGENREQPIIAADVAEPQTLSEAGVVEQQIADAPPTSQVDLSADLWSRLPKDYVDPMLPQKTQNLTDAFDMSKNPFTQARYQPQKFWSPYGF